METTPGITPDPPARCKVAFWKDPHSYSALVAVLLPVVLNHLPPGEFKAFAFEIYGALVGAGIIAARRRSDTDLGLSSGISSTQPGETP